MEQAHIYSEAQEQQDFEDGFVKMDLPEYESLGVAEVARRLSAGEAPFYELNRQRETAAMWLRQQRP